MGKSVTIILGNGFTIDFLNFLGTSGINVSKIDVSNLFKNGENVPWPANDMPGFLSYKHCPNLWTLGARPFLEKNEASDLIEDIITCSNSYFKTWGLKRRDFYNNNSPIYIQANAELIAYLYCLFIYYDSLLSFDKSHILNWGWSKYFLNLYNDPEITAVHIVTLNYDIWLERILKELNIIFNIACFGKTNSKFQIYKPHGSISFQHKKPLKDKIAYGIRVIDPMPELDISNFSVEYTGLKPCNLVCALIPPAGDSNRLSYKWSECIKQDIKEKVQKLNKEDELIICGISYWHVDRLEIDSILTEITPELDCIKIINPYPPHSLNAVITTLFKNVIFYTHCDNLGDC